MDISSPPDTPKHTLFLWPVGNFPRRLTYYLILKGLVADPKDLATGKTTDPNLRINVITLNLETDAWDTSIPVDPVPEGYTLPCMRVDDPVTGSKTWIHESVSILQYLETTYPSPCLVGKTALSRAQNADMVAVINEAVEHGKVYIRHASKSAHMFTGFPDEHRTEASARDALQRTHDVLRKLQTWARDAGGLSERHPWLAVPESSELELGLPDICLAAWLRIYG